MCYNSVNLEKSKFIQKKLINIFIQNSNNSSIFFKKSDINNLIFIIYSKSRIIFRV